MSLPIVSDGTTFAVIPDEVAAAMFPGGGGDIARSWSIIFWIKVDADAPPGTTLLEIGDLSEGQLFKISLFEASGPEATFEVGLVHNGSFQGNFSSFDVPTGEYSLVILSAVAGDQFYLHDHDDSVGSVGLPEKPFVGERATLFAPMSGGPAAARPLLEVKSLTIWLDQEYTLRAQWTSLNNAGVDFVWFEGTGPDYLWRPFAAYDTEIANGGEGGEADLRFYTPTVAVPLSGANLSAARIVGDVPRKMFPGNGTMRNWAVGFWITIDSGDMPAGDLPLLDIGNPAVAGELPFHISVRTVGDAGGGNFELEVVMPTGEISFEIPMDVETYVLFWSDGGNEEIHVFSEATGEGSDTSTIPTDVQATAIGVLSEATGIGIPAPVDITSLTIWTDSNGEMFFPHTEDDYDDLVAGGTDFDVTSYHSGEIEVHHWPVGVDSDTGSSGIVEDVGTEPPSDMYVVIVASAGGPVVFVVTGTHTIEAVALLGFAAVPNAASSRSWSITFGDDSTESDTLGQCPRVAKVVMLTANKATLHLDAAMVHNVTYVLSGPA